MQPLTIADSPTIILDCKMRFAARTNLATIIVSMGCFGSPGMTCPEVAHLLAMHHGRWNIGSVVLKETVCRIVGGGATGATPTLDGKTVGGGGSNFALSAEGGWSEREPLGWKNTQYLD